MPKRKTLTVRMRIRIYAGNRMLGPGKMELLSHIDETGSLSAAAKQMGMSYMRAWTLAKELNRDRSVAAALAAAGWITEYADRERIFVVRHEGGTRIRFRAREITSPDPAVARFRLSDGDVVVAE